MSVPLPVRLCCMGVTAMAPALTDAATQPIKLTPESTPASSDSVSVGRQAGDQASKEGQTSIPPETVTKCMIKPNGPAADLPTVSHLNGNSLRPVQAVDKQSPAFPKLQGAVGALAVPGQIKKHIVINKSVLLQNLKINATSLLCGKVIESGTTMSRPPAALDKEDGKYQGHCAQNRTHACRQLSGTSSGKASAGNQHPTGNHLYVQKPGGSMCPNTSAAGEGKPSTSQAPTIPSNHFHAGGAMNHKHLKCTNVSKVQGVSLAVASTSDGHEVDRTVSQQYDEASKKQAQLERRVEFLQRRQRRLQARQMERHIKQERSSFVDYHQQNLQTVSASGSKSSPGFQNSDDLNKELLSDGAKHMSTAALVSLVHKMQKQGSTSQLPVLGKPAVTTVLNISDDDCRESQMVADRLTMNLRMTQSALDSDATETSSGGETDGEDRPRDVSHPPPAMPLSRRAEWKWLSDRAAIASKWTWLQAQVSDLEYRIRQQTESYRLSRSSKGPVVLAEPSASLNVVLPRNQPLVRSHDGRTVVVPSSAILQGSRQLPSDAQPSHLSQLAKCSSTVAGSALSSSGSSLLVTTGLHSRGDAMQTRLTTSLPLNANRRDGEDNRSGGDHASSSSSSSPPADLDPATDLSSRAARCLPLRQALCKRKLVRTSGLEFQSSAKAAKLSTVKCHCHLTMTPCVLCSGKGKRIQTVDPHYMSFPERVALMDPSNHPVLSFPEEVPLSVHFEGLLRSSGEWQNKAAVRRPRAEQGQRSQKVGKLSNHAEGRKALLRKSQSSVIIQSAKIRNKYEQKTGRKLGPPQGLTLNNRALSADLKCLNLNHAPFSVGRGRGRGRGRRRRGQGSRGGYLRRDLGRQSSSLSAAGDLAGGAPYPREREVRRRRGESAYDINSIVIPRSMAAATRPEKLEYKEIPTPSWRHLKEGAEVEPEEAEAEAEAKASIPTPKSNGLIAKETEHESDETEDLSDEIYIYRHNLCEVAEKKRFSSAVRTPHHRRRRVARAAAVVVNRTIPALHPNGAPFTPTPLSMGTQVSMDIPEVEESDVSFVERLEGATLLRPQPATPLSTLAPPNGDDLGPAESVGSRRGSVSLPELESAFPCTDGEDPALAMWPSRRFPLTDDEVRQLEKEDLSIRDEEKAPRPNLHAVSRNIQNLRPHPVETGGSQAGSSVSSSLPPSPLPSTSSASVAEDWDAADVEWTLDSDMVKKKALQSKSTKR